MPDVEVRQCAGSMALKRTERACRAEEISPLFQGGGGGDQPPQQSRRSRKALVRAKWSAIRLVSFLHRFPGASGGATLPGAWVG